MLTPLIGAVCFGLIASLATVDFSKKAVVPNVTPLHADLMRIVVCCVAATNGAILLAHVASPETLLAFLIVTAALGATCVAGMTGHTNAVVPGAALIVVVAASLLNGDFGPLVSSIVLELPFAACALFPGGSFDRENAIVASLGGALFGIGPGLVVVGFGCVVALLIIQWRDKRGKPGAGRLTFAPVIATVVLVATAGQLAIS